MGQTRTGTGAGKVARHGTPPPIRRGEMTDEHHATRDGVRIAYETRPADGAPWAVLVHGLGYSRRAWGPLIDALEGRCSLLLLDNRGIGGSDVPSGPYTAAQLAGDVLAVLDDAGLETAHLVGTSLGGMVAQEVAIAAPERVDRLVLLASTPGGSAAAPMPEVTQRLLAQAGEMDPHEALRRLTANALGPDADPAIVDEIVVLRSATAQDPAGWQAQAAAGTTYDSGGRVAEIAAPTLVVHGTDDAVVAPDNATHLAEAIPDARVAWIEGGGHLAFWEQPARVAELIAAHLTEGPLRGAGAGDR